MVVIEEGDSAAFGFDDVALVIGISPDVRYREPGVAGDVDELNRRGDGGIRLGNEKQGRSPFPERSGERIDQRAAESKERSTEEASTREVHGSVVS